MRLRRKITMTFFLISSLVSLLLALFLHRLVERQLTVELRARLRVIAELGVRSIDHVGYQGLRAQVTGELDTAAVTAVEHSPAFRALRDQLQAIQAIEPELVRFAYLLMPTADPDRAVFVVDADVVDGAPADARLSHFAQGYDVSSIPALRRALLTCATQVEDVVVYDAAFDVSSLSAYAPLGPAVDGRCPGVLGIDIADREMRAALDRAGVLALRISLAAIGLALLISMVMGTLLTRSVISLSATVTRFAGKDFAARTAIGSRDEIGELARSFNGMAETIQRHNDHLEELVEQRTSELSAEKQTSERLLLNVLPAPIAERLKRGGGLIADHFDDVSVLFADLVGFTALGARTSPEALVTMLDELFSLFDGLAELHGLEKIKTIGDAYMVVAGIPEPAPDHAARIARMGLGMLAAIETYAARSAPGLTIRIGIHSGSVVAGVIGRKKFIYDLWGDTVNTASRMESHGLPARVHVSEATYLCLRDGFELESRGEVDIKGKGVMTTYLLVGER